MLVTLRKATAWRLVLHQAGCHFCTGSKTEVAPQGTSWEHPPDNRSENEEKMSTRDLALKLHETHKKLRDAMLKGENFEEIWHRHISDTSNLSSYAASMQKMANKWEHQDTSLKFRNSWIMSQVKQYYFMGRNLSLLQDEIRKANQDPSVLTPSEQELLGDLQRLLQSQRQQKLKKSSHGTSDTSWEQGRPEEEAKVACQEVARAAGPALVLPGASPMSEALVYTEGTGGVRQFEDASRVKVLDVGSCYNPLGQYPGLLVTPIDLMPASKDVYKCDFLKVEVVEAEEVEGLQRGCQIERLPRQHYDVVVFSLVLDYIPCPEARLRCCRKAHQLLRPGGLLLIITPIGTGVVGALFFKWAQWHLAQLGFSQLKGKKNDAHRTFAYRKAFFPSLCSETEAERIAIEIEYLQSCLKMVNYRAVFDEVDLSRGIYFTRDVQVGK